MKADLKSGRRGVRGVARVLLLVVASILLGWLVVKSSAVSALARRTPAMASMISPGDPRPWMRNARLELLASGGRVTPLTHQRVREAAVKMPMADEPFLLAAIRASVGGELVRADRLLREARRRDPRSRITRLLLLNRHLQSGRTEEALSEMQALMRLIPQAETLLAGELARYAKDEASRPALKRLLASDPGIQTKVLDQLAQAGTDPEVVLGLASGDALRVHASGAPAWQGKLVENLLRRGDAQGAYALWVRFSGVSPTGQNTLYDPSFRGLPGPLPFNWYLAEGSLGAAAPLKGRGLEVEYFGREGGTLAEQLLMLDPGRYRFSFRAEGDAPEQGGKLVWSISCSEGTPLLLEVPLLGSASNGQVSRDFSVPSGCVTQRLALKGIPAEFPKTQLISLTDLNLRKTS